MTLADRVAGSYESNREAVYRYLVVRGVEPGVAQEITQEAFLRLHTELTAGRDVRNDRAWVFAVAHNLGESWRSTGAAGAGLEYESAAPEEGPEQRLLGAERMVRLRRAVAALSPQQRVCLHLRAEGMRYREIGEVLGIGTSTVSEFLRRAIERLRKAVEE